MKGERNKTETELRLQYVERTWDFNFSEPIDEAIEDDYVDNNGLYTDEMFGILRAYYLLCPYVTPCEMVKQVHD